MTRTGDIAPPVLTPHPIDPTAPIAAWRYVPLVALELLGQAAYVWDDSDIDVIWDDTTPERVWDAPFVGSGFSDAVCDFVAIDVDPGDTDDLYLFAPVSCTVTLDNRSGAYTPWSADGRLVYWAPGRRLHLLARDVATDELMWLFSGRVASWTTGVDDTVTVVAYDGLSWLAQEPGGTWTPGAAGNTVTQRITAVTAAAGYPDRVDADAGTVTLSTAAVDVSWLEAIQRAALSDGGLFYGDADGSLDYRNRLWRTGRSDQPRVYAVSDNICDADVVVWDVDAAADDERLVTDVRLVNEAGLASTAALTGSLWAGDVRYRLSHPDPDLWQTQSQGDTLATYLLAQQSTPSLAINRLSLYVQDPRQQPEVWDLAVRTRRGDRVEIVHDFTDPAGQPAQLDLYSIVLGVAHSITPEQWVSSLSLSRTVDWRTVEQWDRTRFTWDDPDALNTWRY